MALSGKLPLNGNFSTVIKSRASFRYGSTTVFTGPVRKWKKKWVHVTPSSSLNNTNTNNNAHDLANSNASSLLLLRRWTPTTDDDATATDEPPRRKFHYTHVGRRGWV
ncbi:hypothetical protein VIGAN_06085600 [Vigna angularis var. angularis]|uniref:Uncharacterized protein n=1 Tax=Vigna angularis var. angularis TaxID=157739 RepID=A0A0S3SA99_PHAAN|nr:hypothetical protein VIGAN_06085600 [Vigna angularis var. angularis]